VDLEDLILTALERGSEPPRVPTFIQTIMPGFFKQWEDIRGDEIEDEDVYLTEIQDLTIHNNLGYDSSWIGFQGPTRIPPTDMQSRIKPFFDRLPESEKTEGYFVGEGGGLYKKVSHQGFQTHYLVRGVIKSEDEWRTWFEGWDIVEPKNDSIAVFNKSRAEALAFKKPHLMIPTCSLIIEPLLGQMDLGRMSYIARKKPQFFRKVIEFITKPTLMKLKMMCESNSQIILTADDCAYKGRPILSPKLYREFIIPYWKQYADIVHKAGKILIMHSDGNLQPYYDDLIEAGLDVHQSLEPLAGNDLGEVKAKWGDRLSFIGNMDISDLLAFGTVEKVIETTKQCLRDGMPGSGYIFSTCSDLINLDKVDLVEAMMATVKKYGKYPVNIPN
jgi:Uroporphyrinogen decarboxylase (URO-D)